MADRSQKTYQKLKKQLAGKQSFAIIRDFHEECFPPVGVAVGFGPRERYSPFSAKHPDFSSDSP
jgi:hypothetical protein